MKVAVITGAASGIGLALSQVYLEQEVHVVMVDIHDQKLHEEAETLSSKFPNLITTITCDITIKEEVSHLVTQVKELGQVDWLYNNAGIIGHLSPLWEAKTDEIHQVMNVNLFGMIHLIQAFIPLLFEQPFNSHIINMASLYALCTTSQAASYAMSKHAVLALSESLYFDLQRLNKPVSISVVFPSFTDTGLISNAKTSNPFQESLVQVLKHSRSPLDVARHIVHAVEKNRFYIFPDKEVKSYCEERTKSILAQENPHLNPVEQLMRGLIKRVNRR